MKQSNAHKKEPYFVLVLVILVVGLLTFRFMGKKVDDTASFFESGISFNKAFKELPNSYLGFNEKTSIDVILDSTEGRFDKIKNLKFDAFISENEYSREVVLIKKITSNDTLVEPIRLDVYPINPENPKRKYFTYTTNSITYSYKGFNYNIARQVLPNVAIKKIIPYTRNWQTAIPVIDNSMLSSKDAPHLKNAKRKKTDSLAIGINTTTSVYGFLLSKALRENNISFLSVTENLKRDDILNISEIYKEYSKANKTQLIYIQNDISFWDKLTREGKIGELNFLNSNAENIKEKLNAFVSGSKTFAEVFDIEKLATYYTLLNLYTNPNSNNLFLNYNEETTLLEPYFVKRHLGALNTYVKDLKIRNVDFSKRFARLLTRFSGLGEINEIIDDNRVEIKELLEVIHQKNPMELFDKKTFLHNKLIIEKVLNPSTVTKIALVKYDEKQIEVAIENLANFPVEISELSYKQNKFITGPHKERVVVMPLEKKKVTFDLPDSYNNLFVHKKKKTTGFIFEKDIFDLAVGYRLMGTDAIKYNIITPFQDFTELAKGDDLFRNEIDISTFEFLSVDDNSKEITFVSDSIVLSQPLVFPEGFVVKATAGLQINIKAGGKIISKSPIQFLGSEEEPIQIYSSDGNGQGVFVVSATKISKLNYVEFDNLTNPSHGLWDLTGAVVFYESPVNLDHVLISNNSCEDGLNIIRTSFTMTHTTFRNTQSDAFDGDFVEGTLTNCTFENLGNDAVDVSGSKLELYDLYITKAGDKALSAGENSQMTGNNINISYSEIAIAGKDLSIVDLTDVTISNSKLGFTAFQKKPEFGVSNIKAKNVVMTQVETSHLIEKGSSLLLNGKESETIEAVKEQMYGVEFGVDSKETRVKKKS